MRQFNLASLSNQQEVLIKRYYEIHFDFSNEFRNTSVSAMLSFWFPSVIFVKGHGAEETGKHGIDAVFSQFT